MSQHGSRILALALANLRVSPLKSTILVVLAIVLIVFVARAFTRGPTTAEAAVESALLPAPEESAQPAPPAPRPRYPLPSLARTLSRDPFGHDWIAPPAAPTQENAIAEVGEDELALQFTMTGDGDQATAVISGFVVRPGATVAGYEVVSIGVRQVVLRNAAGTRILRMP